MTLLISIPGVTPVSPFVCGWDLGLTHNLQNMLRVIGVTFMILLHFVSLNLRLERKTLPLGEATSHFVTAYGEGHIAGNSLGGC